LRTPFASKISDLFFWKILRILFTRPCLAIAWILKMETSVLETVIFIDEFQLFDESFCLFSLSNVLTSFLSDLMDAVVPPTIISLAACGLFAFEEVSFGLRNQRSWDMLCIKLIKKRWSLGHEEWTKLHFVEVQTWVKRSPCTANSWVMWGQKESMCYIHDILK